MLIPTFTKTTNGYTVRLSLDGTKLPTGYDSYDITLSFDPTKLKWVSDEFAGDLKFINRNDLSAGRLVVSGVSSTQRLPASTAVGTLTFESLTTGPLLMTVSRLNVNGFTYVSDTSPLTINSSVSGGTTGGGGTDTTPPTLAVSDPAGGSSVSPTKEIISLGFSEPVVKGTGTIVLKTTAGATVESFDITTSTRLTLSGPAVTIDPLDNFAGSTSYQLVIPAGAFKDGSGNPYAGTTLAFSTTAATIDTSPPTLSQVTPSSGTTNVATDAKIVLKFSEAISRGQSTIQLLGPGGVLVQSFDANSAAVVIAGDTITLTPSAALAKASTYTLQLPSGAIVDKAGNPFAGLQNYQFTTSALTSGELRITQDRNSVDEGGTVTFTLRATSSAPGTVLSYSFSGVGRGDLDGTPMGGTVQLDSARGAELSVKIKADDLTEGSETLVLNVAGITSSVTINDTSRASLVPQNLKGGFGAEVFLLSTGEDLIDGGTGVDTAFVNGQADDFEINRQGTKVFLSQKSSQNVDTLSNVERLEFTDRSVALDTDGGPGQAYRIYKAAFNREPDLPGMGYWISKMDQQMDMLELAQRFVDSSEFKAVYGAQPTNTAFISKLYQNVLNRAADSVGLSWWVNEMNTNPAKSRAKVLADFSESAENKTALTGLMEDGVPFLPWQG